MMVDRENSNLYVKGEANHTLPKGRLLQEVLNGIENTPQHFFKALSNHFKKYPEVEFLNENGLTKIFTEQSQIQITKLKSSISIHVGVEYVDIFRKTKGQPDIHYTRLEEGKTHEPIFIMEAKRLTTLGKHREKEYVHGINPSGNPNGGIERFKLEIHGKGLKVCGLLGYIEEDNPEIWLKKVNEWILDLTPEWSEDECLTLNSETNHYSKLSSKCHRQNDTIQLHHFWLYQNTNLEDSDAT